MDTYTMGKDIQKIISKLSSIESKITNCSCSEGLSNRAKKGALTNEEKDYLDKLNGKKSALIAGFNKILKENGIEGYIEGFSVTRDKQLAKEMSLNRCCCCAGGGFACPCSLCI